MKAISRQGQDLSGNRFGAAPLCHTLGNMRAKDLPVLGRESGRDFAFVDSLPLQEVPVISAGQFSAVKECGLENANGGAIEQMQESLAGAGAILPARQDAFEESAPYKEKVFLGEGGSAGILPPEYSLVMAYISSCRQGDRMIYVNPQIAHLGFAMEAWLGKTDLRLQQAHEDDFERIAQAIQHSCSTGEKFNCCYRLYDSNRKIHWFHDEASMTCDESGIPLFASGVMLDITGKKEMEAELDDHRHFLEQHVEMRTRQLIKRMKLLESCNATLSGKLMLAQTELATLKQPATAPVEQTSNGAEYPDGIGVWARNIIDLTRDNWVEDG